MHEYLRAIDQDTTGNRCDVTPLFADPDSLRALSTDLASPFRDLSVSHVACLDALGFILGTAVALELNAGVVPIRKAGKLPVEADLEPFVDYTGDAKALELRRLALGPSCRVLIVDEWSETGAQLWAATALVERQLARIVGIAAIHIEENETSRALAKRYRVHTVSK